MATTRYLVVPHLSTKDLTRIFSKIQVDRTTGCWIWTRARSGGYGVVSLGNVAFNYVHRLMYAWLVEPLPTGVGQRRMGKPLRMMELDHVVCNNTLCCNPAHVRLSTVKDNVLRGNGISATNARKTVCPKGHEFTQTPLQRKCLICNRTWSRESYRRRNHSDPARHRVD